MQETRSSVSTRNLQNFNKSTPARDYPMIDIYGDFQHIRYLIFNSTISFSINRLDTKMMFLPVRGVPHDPEAYLQSQKTHITWSWRRNHSPKYPNPTQLPSSRQWIRMSWLTRLWWTIGILMGFWHCSMSRSEHFFLNDVDVDAKRKCILEDITLYQRHTRIYALLVTLASRLCLAEETGNFFFGIFFPTNTVFLGYSWFMYLGEGSSRLSGGIPRLRLNWITYWHVT